MPFCMSGVWTGVRTFCGPTYLTKHLPYYLATRAPCSSLYRFLTFRETGTLSGFFHCPVFPFGTKLDNVEVREWRNKSKWMKAGLRHISSSLTVNSPWQTRTLALQPVLKWFIRNWKKGSQILTQLMSLHRDILEILVFVSSDNFYTHSLSILCSWFEIAKDQVKLLMVI